jgi:hypothetical protein
MTLGPGLPEAAELIVGAGPEDGMVGKPVDLVEIFETRR